MGEETFRDRHLSLVDKAKGIKLRTQRSTGGPAKDHAERDAERLIPEHGVKPGLPLRSWELAELPKGDERKAMMAALIRRRTAVGTNGLPAGFTWDIMVRCVAKWGSRKEQETTQEAK